ncbi:MAG: hypothetical protein LRY40_04985 [Shewanella fodinae]|nr:hypothetical protein [Shewanella fodinae]
MLLLITIPKTKMAEGKEWISYINNQVTPGSGAGTKATTEWQAGIETSCKLDCITNLGSGHYRYTFSKALNAYSQFDGLDTSYDANATTRIYLELLPSSDSDVTKKLINITSILYRQPAQLLKPMKAVS